MVIEARRKVKTKKREKHRTDGGEVKKEEYAVAKYVRFNCPTKIATIMGDEMPYFTASKAVDCLMTSKWVGDSDKKLFNNRHGCVFYMQTLLDKGLFFRAKKLVPKKRETKYPSMPDVETKTEASGDKQMAKRKEDIKNSDALKTTEQKKKEIKEKDGEQVSGKKKAKKVKFDVHQNQIFNDGNDIYVWKYDPTSPRKFLLGLAMVFGSIGVCLFPLWPHEVRLGVYYLSVVAMVFVGVILFLVILRSIIFGTVWLFTLGKHHFWLLPNLTEDCGFFDSFKPLYSHKLSGASQKGREKLEQTSGNEKSVEDNEPDDNNSGSGGDQDGKNSDDDINDNDNELQPGGRNIDDVDQMDSTNVSELEDDGESLERPVDPIESLAKPPVDIKLKNEEAKKDD